MAPSDLEWKPGSRSARCKLPTAPAKMNPLCAGRCEAGSGNPWPWIMFDPFRFPCRIVFPSPAPRPGGRHIPLRRGRSRASGREDRIGIASGRRSGHRGRRTPTRFTANAIRFPVRGGGPSFTSRRRLGHPAGPSLRSRKCRRPPRCDVQRHTRIGRLAILHA